MYRFISFWLRIYIYIYSLDVLIEDFCSLAGTLDLETGEEYQRKWFRSVFVNDVDTPNPTCEELGGIDTPRETAGSDCNLRTPPPTKSPIDEAQQEQQPPPVDPMENTNNNTTALGQDSAAAVPPYVLNHHHYVVCGMSGLIVMMMTTMFML